MCSFAKGKESTQNGHHLTIHQISFILSGLQRLLMCLLDFVRSRFCLQFGIDQSHDSGVLSCNVERYKICVVLKGFPRSRFFLSLSLRTNRNTSLPDWRSLFFQRALCYVAFERRRIPSILFFASLLLYDYSLATYERSFLSFGCPLCCGLIHRVA